MQNENQFGQSKISQLKLGFFDHKRLVKKVQYSKYVRTLLSFGTSTSYQRDTLNFASNNDITLLQKSAKKRLLEFKLLL